MRGAQEDARVETPQVLAGGRIQFHGWITRMMPMTAGSVQFCLQFGMSNAPT
jgi:hypothetical protein